MTSKPETVSQEAIPQDVWDGVIQEAVAGLITAHQHEPDRLARALTLATAQAIKSGIRAAKAEEREACAVVADSLPIGELIQTNETDLKRLWKWSGSAQAGAIGAAIRKRGEVSTAHNKKSVGA